MGRYGRIVLMAVILLLLTACGAGGERQGKDTGVAVAQSSAQTETRKTADDHGKTGRREMRKLMVEVGGQVFEATLESNETVEALEAMLPMTLSMEEMNGNEKYDFFDQALPAEAKAVGSIHAGDIMLYGSDCLVLFFKDFSTSYSYTKIGHVDDAAGFARALGKGTVKVTLRVAE